MMKKILAALLAVMMVFCVTGCTEATEKPVEGMLTLDEFTQAFDMAIQQEKTEDTLSLPVTFGLRNSEELLDFMTAVTQGQPTTYVNTLKEYATGGVLQEVTYTVAYEGGTSATIVREAVGKTDEPMTLAGFTMASLMQICSDAEGNFDVSLFSQLMHAQELDYWLNNFPYHMIYGVNAVIAVTTDGQYVLFDYYFDSSVVSMLNGSIG